MKRLLIVLLLVGASTASYAQLPVIDVAGLARAVASLAELREQVRLLMEEVELMRSLHTDTQTHLRRYEQSLKKRGLVGSAPLGGLLRDINDAQHTPDAVTYADPGRLREIYLLFDEPPNPLEMQRTVAGRTMATLEGTLGALARHNQSLVQTHAELERFKTEIASSLEPQEMRDVQASLQVMHARESALTRQALMALVNLEAVRAAEAVSQKAQAEVRYNTFLGGSDWLRDPTRYQIDRFLRMPGQ